MISFNWLILAFGGLVSGGLAGLLGIGGGVILVPLMVTLGYTPLQSVATSSLVILISSLSGSMQNWRMGYFDTKRVIYLGIPALVMAQAGVYLATRIPPYLLLFLLGVFFLTNIYLIQLKKRLTVQKSPIQKSTHQQPISLFGLSTKPIYKEDLAPFGYAYGYSSLKSDRHRETFVGYDPLPELSRISSTSLVQKPRLVLPRVITGSIAGFLAGLLGVGGGAILVPFQMLFLGESIKVAIQTSLGVIVGTAASACLGHAISGNNILGLEGIILGAGGLLGSQFSTRVLPKLSDSLINLIFRGFFGILSIYMFWQSSTKTDSPTFWLLIAFTTLIIAGILLIRFCVSRLSSVHRSQPSIPLLQHQILPILMLLLILQSLALAWNYRGAIAQQWMVATHKISTLVSQIGQPKISGCLKSTLENSDQQEVTHQDYLQICHAMQDILNVPSGQFFYGGTMGAAALRSKNFLKEIQTAHPEFRLRYLDPLNAPPDSTTGIKMLLDGELSFAESQRPLKDQEYQQAKDRGFMLKQIPIAMTGATFYTHRDLRLPGLSIEQLQAIYLGQVTNWKELGGPNLPIIPVSQDKDATGSTLSLLLENFPPGNQPLSEQAQYVRDTTAALRTVATTPGAIGFGTQVLVAQQQSVHPLGIAKANSHQYVASIHTTGDINRTALQDGTYPLIQRIFVIIRQDGTLDEMAGFSYANLLLSEKGQALINQAGYLPLRIQSTDNPVPP